MAHSKWLSQGAGGHQWKAVKVGRIDYYGNGILEGIWFLPSFMCCPIVDKHWNSNNLVIVRLKRGYSYAINGKFVGLKMYILWSWFCNEFVMNYDFLGMFVICWNNHIWGSLGNLQSIIELIA